MIVARHTITGSLVTGFCSRYMLGNAFSPIRYVEEGKDEGLPVLMIANHFSWWDGFIQYRINKELYNRTFHVMMLEEQLQHHMILNKSGAYSIRKNSRDIFQSLQYTLRLLESKNNLVLIFPQGKIESLYTSPVRFEQGITYLLKKVSNEIQLLFNVNLVDYFSRKKPGLTVYTKWNEPHQHYKGEEIEEEYNRFMENCKAQQQEI